MTWIILLHPSHYTVHDVYMSREIISSSSSTLTRVVGLGSSAAALYPCDLSPWAQLDLLVHLRLQREKCLRKGASGFRAFSLLWFLTMSGRGRNTRLYQALVEFCKVHQGQVPAHDFIHHTGWPLPQQLSETWQNASSRGSSLLQYLRSWQLNM